ncbi:hypothetical protein Godav_024767 [Gossypium davidsonii]|uniref:Uncharacterized protein n=2 Tax=Gossypium TaxID=3633 RepID=A0A7J8TIX3_GOSDV|nr:hypothetical protein [Gossypium davidsonii]MBA0673213.1 hypothetical protein [Gossypium klotzschianum]
MEGYISELWDFTRVNVTQSNLQELKEIWAQWDDEVKQNESSKKEKANVSSGKVCKI